MARYDQGTIQAPPLGPDIPDTTFMIQYFQKLVSAVVSGHFDASKPQDAAKGLIWAEDVSGDIHIKLFDGSVDHTIAIWTSADGLKLSPIAGVFEKDSYWQNVGGSRSPGTTYQNTSGYDIEVMVTAFTATDRAILVSTDNFASDSVLVGWLPATSVSTPNTFTVPDGHYYRVDGAVNSYTWSERRA